MKLRPILCLSILAAGAGIAVAQDSSEMKPPAVIQINREWLKPGKSGAVHDRSEAAFVSLMNKGKLKGHYLALNSMSGKPRSLYMTRYPSFEAWENDNKIFEKNASLGAELDRDISADSELLEGMDSAVLVYNEGLSFHPRPDFSHARYYELTAFKVRLGHEKEWREVTKMYKEACEKAGAGLHWGAYAVTYGGESGTYIMLTHRESLAEIDKEQADSKKIMEAMGGEEGAAKADQMFAAAVESVRSELFTINPRQSYVDEATMKADADFWKPKAPKSAVAASAKPAASAQTKPASR
ncbi:MAG: hypothetical protein JST28_23960 [Acidobacteria bacterium]|nr:hypothetical protein [Acidobacteriota bacterium]